MIAVYIYTWFFNHDCRLYIHTVPSNHDCVYMYTRFFRTMIAVIYSHARISQARLPLYIDTSDRFG